MPTATLKSRVGRAVLCALRTWIDIRCPILRPSVAGSGLPALPCNRLSKGVQGFNARASQGILCTLQAFGSAHPSRLGAQGTARPTGWVLWLLALLMIGAGCHRPHGTILGKAPKGEPATILAIRAGDTPSQVTVSGVMVEKCPVAGCWLKVQDTTGAIMIDTKSAGFVVVNVPLESKVTVTGKIVTEGDEVFLEAAGLRY